MSKILITGGPGTGKTSLINWMQEHGYFCSKEIVREITKRKREDGHDQYFLSDPLSFSIELFNKRFEEYKKNYNSDHIFYDRGPLDVLAYLDFKNVKILWASVREPYNYIESKKIGCHIITVPPKIIEKIEKFGKSFNQLSIETVRGFLKDSKKSNFKI